MAETKYRRPLNKEQLDVLLYLYAYRFVTNEYIAKLLDKTNVKVVQKKLKILEDQGYIAKRYDKTYKLRGKPAEYYLTPKGARLLASKRGQELNIKNLYKNPTISDEFVAHCINVLKYILEIRKTSKSIKLYTKEQFFAVDYFPKWKPDVYIILGKKRFFLDILDEYKPFFVYVRKVRNYIRYLEEGDWPTDDKPFPTLLFACDSKKTETKLRRQINRALEDTYEEPYFATTTFDILLNSPNRHWLALEQYDDDEGRKTLTGLIAED